MKKLATLFLLGIATFSATSFSTPQSTTQAHVISVQAKGQSKTYWFSVSIQSPDTGCDQYANWWEVFTEKGDLLYRRILFHSHVDEQPFVRSGGPIAIPPTQIVWIRAHMHPHGYGGKVFKGSVTDGFHEEKQPKGFFQDLAQLPPQPNGCSF